MLLHSPTFASRRCRKCIKQPTLGHTLHQQSSKQTTYISTPGVYTESVKSIIKTNKADKRRQRSMNVFLSCTLPNYAYYAFFIIWMYMS